MSILWVINGILLVIILAAVFNELYLRIMVRRSAKMLMEGGFREATCKTQVIGVHEKDTLDAGYILGVRNMPYSMLKTAIGFLRKDRFAYFYDQKKTLSIRTANLLRKDGYTDIYILKDGYDGWTGRVRKRSS